MKPICMSTLGSCLFSGVEIQGGLKFDGCAASQHRPGKAKYKHVIAIVGLGAI